jgi:hypothetical protein
MIWKTTKSLWACVKPNGELLSFYAPSKKLPHIFTRRSAAYAMLNNPRHKVARVVKVNVTVEEVE